MSLYRLRALIRFHLSICDRCLKTRRRRPGIIRKPFNHKETRRGLVDCPVWRLTGSFAALCCLQVGQGLCCAAARGAAHDSAKSRLVPPAPAASVPPGAQLKPQAGRVHSAATNGDHDHGPGLGASRSLGGNSQKILLLRLVTEVSPSVSGPGAIIILDGPIANL